MRTKENWLLFLPHGVDHGTEGKRTVSHVLVQLVMMLVSVRSREQLRLQ